MPGCRVEVLIPDFRGDWNALGTVMAAKPDVLNHNMETVPRLYRRVRKGAVYERSLELLKRAGEMAPGIATKTGMMLGLGETRDEVLQAMEEIAAQGTHILTLGQYLQPTPEHLPIERYVHPDEFAEYKRAGETDGIQARGSGPAGALLLPRLRAGRSGAGIVLSQLISPQYISAGNCRRKLSARCFPNSCSEPCRK